MPTTYSDEHKDWVRNIGCLTSAFRDTNLTAKLVDVFEWHPDYNAHGTFFLSKSKAARPTFRNETRIRLPVTAHNNAC